MGKARTDRRGQTREQRLARENDKLKRAVSSLRKQLAKLDIDRVDIAREVIQECYKEERAQEGKEILENLKKAWACKECQVGYLEIFIYNHSNTTYYYRICSNVPDCGNRTLPKAYDETKVNGIYRK